MPMRTALAVSLCPSPLNSRLAQGSNCDRRITPVTLYSDDHQASHSLYLDVRGFSHERSHSQEADFNGLGEQVHHEREIRPGTQPPNNINKSKSTNIDWHALP